MATAPVYSTFEGRLSASATHSTPFALWCWVLVGGPVASRRPLMNVTLFYDGGTEWAFRFSPDVPGAWRWRSECAADPGLDDKSGVLKATPSTGGLGGLLANPQHPQHLMREAGTPFVPVGLEVDWLWAVGLTRGLDAARSLVDGLATQGVNHVLVNTYANFSSWAPLPPRQPPRLSPTLLTPWASADQLALDLAFFRGWDALLTLLQERGIVAHVMVYVGNKNVAWPARGSAADDLFWRHCVARWDASAAVVWDVSKEAGSYGVGDAYALGRLRLLSNLSAHRRLVTAHSGLSWSNSCGEQDGTLCTLVSAQVHFNTTSHGKGPPVLQQEARYYAATRALVEAHPATPVALVEFFYQRGPLSGCNGSCCGGCAASPAELDAMRRVAWDAYMAGSSAVWYHCDLSWDVIDARAVGALAPLATLRRFWEGVGARWRLAPPRDAAACVRSLSPPDATVHCLVTATDEADEGAALRMVLHVRTPRARLVPVVPAGCGGGGGRGGGLTGFWLDPATGTQLPFEPSTTPAAPPPEIAGDAVLYVSCTVQ